MNSLAINIFGFRDEVKRSHPDGTFDLRWADGSSSLYVRAALLRRIELIEVGDTCEAYELTPRHPSLAGMSSGGRMTPFPVSRKRIHTVKRFASMHSYFVLCPLLSIVLVWTRYYDIAGEEPTWEPKGGRVRVTKAQKDGNFTIKWPDGSECFHVSRAGPAPYRQ